MVRKTEREAMRAQGCGEQMFTVSDVTLQGEKKLLRRRKASTHGVLTGYTLDHELFQVALPSRLGAHP